MLNCAGKWGWGIEGKLPLQFSNNGVVVQISSTDTHVIQTLCVLFTLILHRKARFMLLERCCVTRLIPPITLQLTSSNKPTIKTAYTAEKPWRKLSGSHAVKATARLSNWALYTRSFSAKFCKPLKVMQMEMHLPIQTSPNCPAPSLRSSFRDSRGISHSSCHQGFCGALDWHGFTSFVHSPSASPEWQRKETYKIIRMKTPQ